MGLLRKDSGTVKIKDIDPDIDLKSALRLVGYVPQKLSLPVDLKVMAVETY